METQLLTRNSQAFMLGFRQVERGVSVRKTHVTISLLTKVNRASAMDFSYLSENQINNLV